jgi:hypothetical protein
MSEITIYLNDGRHMKFEKASYIKIEGGFYTFNIDDNNGTRKYSFPASSILKVESYSLFLRYP